MTPPVTTSAPITPLTPTLQRVAQHLATGLTAQEIATQTALSPVTIRQYIRDIRESLHCPPRCKPPVIVHRLFVDQQVAPPTADRPAPMLSPDELLLLRAVASTATPATSPSPPSSPRPTCAPHSTSSSPTRAHRTPPTW
ncbi:helix-turn-helix transcriptional regulator [Streptomyces cellulosae]